MSMTGEIFARVEGGGGGEVWVFPMMPIRGGSVRKGYLPGIFVALL